MARASINLGQSEFETMSDSELRELMRKAKETLSRRITERIDEFRLLAREAGFEVTLIKLGEGGERRKRGSGEATESDHRRREVTPKYRNPDHPDKTWAGRGRKPKWVEEKLAQGQTLEDLLI